MERRVNRQQTIRSIVRSIESAAVEGNGWNPKDVVQAIMEDPEYMSNHNVSDYSNSD